MSTDTLTGQISQKLPFWSTLEHTYVFWAKNLRELLHVSWLWFAVTAPVLAVFWWWDLPYYNASMRATRAQHPDPTPMLTLALGGLRFLIGLPMTASIAVAWHRLLLRGERCGTATYLRFDRIVIGYVVLSFMLYLILFVTDSIGAMARYFWPSSDLQKIGIGGITGIAFYVFARLIVCLPAKALDREDIALAEVWRRTRGNGWRLAFGSVLTLLPFALIETITFRLAPPLVSSAAVRVGDSILWTLGGTICVGFLSLAYQHFFEQDPNQPIPASLLSSMFERAMYAALADETRYNLNGVYFEVLPDTADTRRCPQCGTLYHPSEYREDIEHWYCSPCNHELPHERKG